MSGKHILLIGSSLEVSQQIESIALKPAGYRVTHVEEWAAVEGLLEDDPPDVVLVNEKVAEIDVLTACADLIRQHPFLPFFLLSNTYSQNLIQTALRQGFYGLITPDGAPEEMAECIRMALERRQRWEEHSLLLVKRDTNSLKKRIDLLEAIERIGRKVTSVLDLDDVLATIVGAAVDMTGAEEGSLLLLDERTGELYMRASRNFQQEFVKAFRLPIRNSLVGQALRTGKPLLIDESTPQKIEAHYLVYTILFMPIKFKDQVIGVLEVDHRHSGKSFSEDHISLLSALADYAAVALENARLYNHSESERIKLELILVGIEDGVIVVDKDLRLVMINRKAKEAFNVQEKNPSGKRVQEVIQHQEFLESLRKSRLVSPSRVELMLDDGRVVNTQFTSIPEIGIVISMQDITYLKDLDQIKSDFVNTVSHDLRSPLTAILGYIELLDRVGPINTQQREFIRRVQISVHSITALINDLLDLGRIEAGFDTQKEIVPFSEIILYTVDGLKNRANERSQELSVQVIEPLPAILGNPVQLRQLLSNLLINALQYTPVGGKIVVAVREEASQVILQITDNGPGIPPADQPFIFDKFYRASNVLSDVPGTGLGLAIVRSIVENHQGRIWVDSTLGEGTTFTVVLPSVDNSL